MPLTPDSRLGPYRIDAEIGSGGMGHVFRATDTRLGRSVAVKVLPADRWSDPELRHRFEREARALSSLSHPNLCALYDVGELQQEGATVPYLVMEHLEGETLRARLDRGPVPLRTALKWAAQLASGLAAAHQKSLIHRDLKPENVIITNGDLLKIVDFGIARDATVSENAPTQLRTQAGFVMGTAEYMSPEQARGTVVTPASDIFALGIVLYEMLTGRSPFSAPTSIQTLNAILVDDPIEPSGIAPQVPEVVDEITMRCLDKNPERRFASARDLALALESAARTARATTGQQVRRRITTTARRYVDPLRATLLLVALAALVAAAIASRRAMTSDDLPPARLETLTYSGRDNAPAASRDGRFVAFVSSRDGSRRIWIKQVADGAEAPITSGPGDTAPRFSPDGSSILFTRTDRNGSALFRVAVVGGDARKVVDDAFDGDWSPDGKRVAFIRNRAGSARHSTVCTAEVDGGAVMELASSVQEEFVWPRWSPDGERVAATRRPRNTAAGSIAIIEVASRAVTVLAREESHGLVSAAAWTRDGSAIVYVELDAVATTGLPQRRGPGALVSHSLRGRSRVLLRSAHVAADTIDLLGDDRIVMVEDFSRQNLQEVSLGESTTPARWLSRGMSTDRQPSYTQDGSHVVFSSDRSGNFDIWKINLVTGALRRLTDHAAIDWDPYPGGDGRSLFWSSNRGGHFEVWQASLDGTGPRQVTRDSVDAENPSAPRAGSLLVYDSSNPAADGLWAIPVAGGPPKQLVRGETIHPEVSPDGQHVVYQRPETAGSVAIDVVPVQGGAARVFARGITGVTAARPRWIGNSAIAFRAAGGDGIVSLYAQDFQAGTDTSATRRPILADTTAPVETFAVSPDGTRAVLAVIDEGSALMLVSDVNLP